MYELYAKLYLASLRDWYEWKMRVQNHWWSLTEYNVYVHKRVQDYFLVSLFIEVISIPLLQMYLSSKSIHT